MNEIEETDLLVKEAKRRMNKVLYRSEQTLGTVRKLNRELDILQEKADRIADSLQHTNELQGGEKKMSNGRKELIDAIVELLLRNSLSIRQAEIILDDVSHALRRCPLSNKKGASAATDTPSRG